MGPSHVTFLVSDRWKACGWCIRQLPFLNCTQHSPAEELCWWLQTSFSMSHKAGDGLSVTNWTREGEHDYLNERRMGWHKRTWIFQNPGRRENVGQSSPVTCSICTQGGKSTLHERLGQAGTWPWCSLAHTVVFMPDRRISKTVRFPFVPNHKEKCTDCKKPQTTAIETVFRTFGQKGLCRGRWQTSERTGERHFSLLQNQIFGGLPH